MTFVDVFKRACVTCESTPSCPTCESDEECVMTTQTCSECPTTYCSAVSNLNDSANNTKKEVGAIAGGVIGGVLLLSLIGFYISYKYYFKPRREAYNKEKDEEFKFHTDTDNVITDSNMGSTIRERRLSQVTLSTMAASVFTKASNVIPVAYIPGVTVKYSQQQQRKKNGAPSIYSDIDTASIIGNEHAANTTTAIRAKPRLVNIDSEDEASSSVENVPWTAVSIINLGGVKTVKIAKRQDARYQPGLQNTLIEEEDEEEEGESVFNLNIELDDNVSSPFHNNNRLIPEEIEEETATTTSSDSESNMHSIEGLSDDDEFDPSIIQYVQNK